MSTTASISGRYAAGTRTWRTGAVSTVVKTVPSFSPTGEAIHSIESTAITCAVGDVIGSTPQARTMGGSPHATAAASDGWVSRWSCPRSLMGVFAKICSHAELAGARQRPQRSNTPTQRRTLQEQERWCAASRWAVGRVERRRLTRAHSERTSKVERWPTGRPTEQWVTSESSL